MEIVLAGLRAAGVKEQLAKIAPVLGALASFLKQKKKNNNNKRIYMS